ncbi:CLOCK-interacting pacemaker-like [Melanotaenia boesemani]|uniref:CLOCK-interacting pacemaker-like n=1 Tax=Melanotaenia boesemani TaxID=1250792 RepID=UPI001C044535|nr:CLOCK-interacting pacemaker-like [Melanotaenia boesemani]
MPKEQAYPGEVAAQSTSKNAKEKSNSATLRACQGGAHREKSAGGEVSKRLLNCDLEKDSEKDSGYSEAGSDDQRSCKSEPHRGNSKPSNNSMAPYEDITPIYVFKNLLVKPSGPEQLLHGPLSWAGGWQSLGGGKAPTQVILIQQPVMPAPSSSNLPPPSCLAPRQAPGKKAGSCSSSFHNNKSSYLPILNSYPRIAPHPRKESNEVKGSVWGGGVKENEGQSQRKRVCTEEEKRETGSVMGPILRPQQLQQREARGGHGSFPSSRTSSSTSQHKSQSCRKNSAPDSVGSPSISSSQTPSPPSCSSSSSSSSPPSSSPSSSSAHSPYHPAPDSTSTRQRRFHNTAEILNQSGLLAITLRTKELLKQSAATERELIQLRQHTNVLCNIAQAGQTGLSCGADNLNKLFQDMDESGSYPNLDLDALRALSSNQTRAEEDTERENQTRTTRKMSVSLYNMDNWTSPPSPLFAPSPEPVSTSVSFSDSIQEHRLTVRDERGSSPMGFPESSTNSYPL